MAPVEKPPLIDPARVQQEQEEGRKAGIAFATVEAEYRDLLMLRKFLESPCDSDFAAELFAHYPDLSYGEFADRLLRGSRAIRRFHPGIRQGRDPGAGGNRKVQINGLGPMS